MTSKERFCRHALIASCFCAALSACDKSEGIHANEASGASPAAASGGSGAFPNDTAATGGMAAAPGCVVPTPAAPPAPAEPAAICPADPGTPPTLTRGEVTFPTAPGSPRVNVEIAREPAEHARGLMYRTSMPEEEGMLFRWDDERVRSFWMRNTCIPLDMLFIARDGTIAGIHEQVPVLNELARSIPCPAAYVLELNAGWCRRHGVQAGMRVVIE